MSLFNKRPQDITETDIFALIGDSEGNQLDVKEHAYPPPPKDKQFDTQEERAKALQEWKIDLCTDICAFANARGGVIVLGAKDNKHRITDVVGLGADFMAESEIMRLQNAAQSGIEPPVHTVQIWKRDLSDESKGCVLLVHVPRSLNAPHRVIHNQRFVIRRSIHNNDMDISEIRNSFVSAATYIEKARQFRDSRLTSVQKNEALVAPGNLAPDAKLIVHAIPVGFADDMLYDISSLFAKRPGNTALSNPLLDWMVRSGTFNIYGHTAVRRYEAPDGQVAEYIHCWRNGIVEYVRNRIAYQQGFRIYAVQAEKVESYITFGVQVAQMVHAALGVRPPILVSVSFSNVAQTRISYDLGAYEKASDPVMNSIISLPETMLQSHYDVRQLAVELRPIFDALANGAGLPRSPRFGEDGVLVSPPLIP